MSDSFETVVKNFSGLSTETKPTIAAGNTVPNGSRWREVDTAKIYYFNLADDTWYEISQMIELASGAKTIITDGTNDVSVTSSGQMHVVLAGIVNAANSSSTPLPADTGGSDHIFTGTYVDVLDYGYIFVTVFADVASATDGLTVCQSSDGVNCDSEDVYTIPANKGKTFSFQPGTQYFKLSYTNNTSAQSAFRLQTIFKKTGSLASSHRIQDSIIDEDDAELVKAVITGKTAGGTFINFSSTNGGNFKTSLEELESGVSSNSNTQLNTTQFDSSGNEISTHLTTDGDYHLGVQVQQDVYEDSNNSSTTNLVAGNSYTFTGTGTSTLGVVGLQWNLKTDQNATVYIEQSDDNTNWDISDSFNYIASEGGNGGTVQAVTAYWRIRVVLTVAINTTYFRLKGILCPIVEALPRSLSDDFRLKTEARIKGQNSRRVHVSPTSTLEINSIVRLVGTNFDGTAKDTNFWTETVTGSGTVTQNGEIKLTTGATANSTTQYDSVRRARFVVGSALQFVGIIKLNNTVTEADNIRRFGAYDDDNGFFFELDGSVFSVGSRSATSDTLVSNESFNGDYGTTFALDETKYYKFDIEYTPLGAYFYINDKLLHKSVGGHLTRVLTLPIRLENNNDNSNTTSVIMDCLGTVIYRQGELETNPTYKYIAGAATTVLKVGAGDLHTIVNNDNSGSVIVYDNTAGSGTIIASIDLAKVLGTLTFNAPFSNGLTLVSTGSGVKITVTYE